LGRQNPTVLRAVNLKNRVTEHSIPNYFSTITNGIRHANVEENLDGETWREVSNSE
jgi:hypothetical protein